MAVCTGPMHRALRHGHLAARNRVHLTCPAPKGKAAHGPTPVPMHTRRPHAHTPSPRTYAVPMHTRRPHAHTLAPRGSPRTHAGPTSVPMHIHSRLHTHSPHGGAGSRWSPKRPCIRTSLTKTLYGKGFGHTRCPQERQEQLPSYPPTRTEANASIPKMYLGDGGLAPKAPPWASGWSEGRPAGPFQEGAEHPAVEIPTWGRLSLTCHSARLRPPGPAAQVYFWGRKLGFETGCDGKQPGRQALTPSDFLSGKTHVAPPAVKLQ